MGVEVEVVKDFVRKLVDALVLWIVSKKPVHGYEIIKKLLEHTGFQFSPGTIYPLLYKLEDKGLIKGMWKQTGKRRGVKLYSLTENGEKLLREIKKLLKFSDRME